MRFICPAIIIVLSAVIFYQYFEKKNIIQSNSMIVSNLQKDIQHTQDRYEEKIARLKFEYETQLSQAQNRPSSNDLSALVREIRSRGQSMRQSVIDRVGEDFNLTSSEFEKFKNILEGYETRKREVMRMSAEEKRPFFDPRFLDMLREQREKTVEQLKDIFNDRQMERLLSHESYQILGLTQDN